MESTVPRYRRVVVKLSGEALADPSGGSGDAGRIGDVEGKGLGADRTGSGRGGLGRTGGQHHGMTTVGELAAHLAADPAIASGNQRYGAHIVDCLHNM